MDEIKNKRTKVYDEEISPLMLQILKICEREKMGVVICIGMGDEEGDGVTTATSIVLGGDIASTPQMHMAAYNLSSLLPGDPFRMKPTVKAGRMPIIAPSRSDLPS